MKNNKLIVLITLSLTLTACSLVGGEKQEFLSEKPMIVEVNDGETFNLTAQPIKKTVDGRELNLLSYNGIIPGPVIKVKQGSKITVNLINKLETPTTLHAHGIRMKNEFDGVPDVTQKPINPGETFTYQLDFLDAGVFWYHPHIREDRDQELGLYGVILVTPAKADNWPIADQEEIIVLDDMLVSAQGQAVFYPDVVTHAIMGRFGNTLMINNQISYNLETEVGKKLRLYLVNVANARPFEFVIDGTQLNLIGSDAGLYQNPQKVSSVVLGPSERAIVEINFDEPGSYLIKNQTPKKSYVLGRINVTDASDEGTNLLESISKNQSNDQVWENITSLLEKPVDKSLRLNMVMGVMGGMGGHANHQGGMMMGGNGEKIEWEDDMAEVNAFSTNLNTTWQLIDEDTGQINHDIKWQFKQGEIVKIRIFNDPNSMHPMQHPIHLHGQRFAILTVDGRPNDNLVWKDTVLVQTGQTIELAVEMQNPGSWALHCHIPEHMESGMMTVFSVI